MPIAGAGRAIAGPPAEILNPTAVDDIKCGIGFDTVVSVMSYYTYKFKSLVVLKFARGRRVADLLPSTLTIQIDKISKV